MSVADAVSTVFAPELFVLVATLLLVWSRIATDAHTVGEAVGGLVVAAVILGVAFTLDRLPGEDGGGIDPL